MRRARALFALGTVAAVAVAVVLLVSSGGDDRPTIAATSGSPASSDAPSTSASTAGDETPSTSASTAGDETPPAGVRPGESSSLTYRPEPGSVEEAAYRPAEDVYEAIADVGVDRGHATAQTLCGLMTDDAIEQTRRYARVASGQGDIDWNCENSVRLLVLRAQRTASFDETLAAEIVGVNVEGDRATASVRFGAHGRVGSLGLVREDGEWKLAATPGAAAGQGG